MICDVTTIITFFLYFQYRQKKNLLIYIYTFTTKKYESLLVLIYEKQQKKTKSACNRYIKLMIQNVLIIIGLVVELFTLS
jgi:hypothetical protein